MYYFCFGGQKGRSGGFTLALFFNLAKNHDFGLSRLTFNFRDLNLTATTNPHLGVAIDLHSRWPTRQCWRLNCSLNLEVSGAATRLMSRKN